MEGRTYPREWYRIDAFNAVVVAQTFTGEDADRLYFAEPIDRRTSIGKGPWFPGREEAEAALANWLANERARTFLRAETRRIDLEKRTLRARRTAERRQRRAFLSTRAEKLLAALVETVDAVGALTNPSEFPNILGIPTERGEEILALIKECRNA